jgi:hypothetical protein
MLPNPTPDDTKYLSPTQIAHRYSRNPSTVIRWITRGALLSSGERLRLKALRAPGGWQVAMEWVDDFLETLTADRMNPEGPTVPTGEIRSVAERNRGHEQAEATLASAGF